VLKILEELFDEVRTIVNADDSKANRMFSNPESREKVIIQAFETYMRLYNRSTVQNFLIIPLDNDHWPKSTWGMRLGQSFQYIKHKGYHKHLHSKLEEMGYNLIVTKSMKDENLLYNAFKNYKEYYNTTRISVTYVVPTDAVDNQRPQEFWGLKLGKRVFSIRYHGHYPKLREPLIDLGYHLSRRQIQETTLENMKRILNRAFLSTKQRILIINETDYPVPVRGKFFL
jgi:hypothetical protein